MSFLTNCNSSMNTFWNGMTGLDVWAGRASRPACGAGAVTWRRETQNVSGITRGPLAAPMMAAPIFCQEAVANNLDRIPWFFLSIDENAGEIVSLPITTWWATGCPWIVQMVVKDFPALIVPFGAEVAGGTTLGFSWAFTPGLGNHHRPQRSPLLRWQQKFLNYKRQHCVTLSSSNEFWVCHSWKAQSLVAFLAPVTF